MKRILCTVLLLAAAIPVVAAPSWQVQPGSTLRFAATTQGEAFDGGFGRFDAAIAFDPADLAGARFTVEIDLASVDTANSERDDALRGAEFFAVESQPQARYIATRFRPGDAPGRFVAEGELSLNGHTRPVPLHFTWAAEGSGAVLEGEAGLDRLAFGLGEGDWADADLIGHDVRVHTRLLLAPAGG